MKRYETVTPEPKPTQYLIGLTCDLCGRETKWRGWAEDCWDVDEIEIKVTIRRHQGQNYPEGGWGTDYEVDLCPECFKDKLIPWLESQGAKVQQTEWDW